MTQEEFTKMDELYGNMNALASISDEKFTDTIVEYANQAFETEDSDTVNSMLFDVREWILLYRETDLSDGRTDTLYRLHMTLEDRLNNIMDNE